MNNERYFRLIAVLAFMLFLIFMLSSGLSELDKGCDDNPEKCDVVGDGF